MTMTTAAGITVKLVHVGRGRIVHAAVLSGHTYCGAESRGLGSETSTAYGAKVVTCVTRQTPTGYVVEVSPPWQGFPGESVEADTEFVNRFIEGQVLRMPEQYFWLHKRFKTRPPGEQRFYK